MAMFRVETVEDPATGLVYAELFFPNDATEAVAQTPAIYPSHEAAEKAVIAHFRTAFPDKPITAAR